MGRDLGFAVGSLSRLLGSEVPCKNGIQLKRETSLLPGYRRSYGLWTMDDSGVLEGLYSDYTMVHGVMWGYMAGLGSRISGSGSPKSH